MTAVDPGGLPPGQRGRRIRWTTAAFTGFALAALASYWISARTGWSNELVLPALALPYWAVVLSIWARYGPRVNGLTMSSDRQN